MTQTSRLAPCPNTPNCVSTEATPEGQRLPPIPFTDSPASALQRARAALLEEPRTAIVGEDSTWLRAESRSLIFRFVDDIDVVIDAESRVVRFRSAARLGKSDLGGNRKRMTRFSARMRDGGE